MLLQTQKVLAEMTYKLIFYFKQRGFVEESRKVSLKQFGNWQKASKQHSSLSKHCWGSMMRILRELTHSWRIMRIWLKFWLNSNRLGAKARTISLSPSDATNSCISQTCWKQLVISTASSKIKWTTATPSSSWWSPPCFSSKTWTPTTKTSAERSFRPCSASPWPIKMHKMSPAS